MVGAISTLVALTYTASSSLTPANPLRQELNTQASPINTSADLLAVRDVPDPPPEPKCPDGSKPDPDLGCLIIRPVDDDNGDGSTDDNNSDDADNDESRILEEEFLTHLKNQAPELQARAERVFARV